MKKTILSCFMIVGTAALLSGCWKKDKEKKEMVKDIEKADDTSETKSESKEESKEKPDKVAFDFKIDDVFKPTKSKDESFI